MPFTATHVDLPSLTDDTIAAWVELRANATPDAVFCTFRDESITCRELATRVRARAARLAALGVGPGDRVALMLATDPTHLVLLLALARLGAVRVPINVHLRGEPLRHPFATLQPHMLIADHEHDATLRAASVSVARTVWREALDDGSDGASPDVLDATVVPGLPAPPHPDDLLALTLSSGTTGAPKGVRKTDRHLRAGAATVLRLTGAGPGDVFLFWEALHHGAGVAVVIAALMGGFRLAMVERFSASRFWQDARDAGATHVHYLGSVVAMLMKQPPRPADRDHRVRVAWGGGCPPSMCAGFAERFGVQVREGYGLSELLTFVTLNPDGPAGSIGKPIAWFDLRLCDDAGAPVPPGVPGELVLRARVPGLGFLGYQDNPEADAASRRGEWFRTGDLAIADPEGWLTYAGRSKEMVRRRGINVSPWEVEQVFAGHPDVEESALVGVPGELGDDELMLYLRLREGCAPDPLALAQWSAGRLPYFQVPRYLRFVDAFPKTPTQRIQKKELPRSTADAWDLEASGWTVPR